MKSKQKELTKEEGNAVAVTDKQKILDYFQKHGRAFDKTGVEEMAGIPLKTLRHFLTGNRDLPDSATDKVIAVLKQLRFK